jgi:hypothetical protein
MKRPQIDRQVSSVFQIVSFNVKERFLLAAGPSTTKGQSRQDFFLHSQPPRKKTDTLHSPAWIGLSNIEAEILSHDLKGRRSSTTLTLPPCVACMLKLLTLIAHSAISPPRRLAPILHALHISRYFAYWLSFVDRSYVSASPLN